MISGNMFGVAKANYLLLPDNIMAVGLHADTVQFSDEGLEMGMNCLSAVQPMVLWFDTSPPPAVAHSKATPDFPDQPPPGSGSERVPTGGGGAGYQTAEKLFSHWLNLRSVPIYSWFR